MKWSFQALYDSVHPMADDLGRAWPADSPEAAKAGKSLANGMRGILYYITGDLEHYGKSLGLPGYRCGNPCFACPCDRRDMPWFELRKAKALWTHHVYVFATALAGLCALFNLEFVCPYVRIGFTTKIWGQMPIFTDRCCGCLCMKFSQQARLQRMRWHK